VRNSKKLRIGTRGSKLALAQAHWVAARLTEKRPDINPEIVIIKTTGDRRQDVRLADIGGKALFVKEIEDALLAGEIDAAVHSMKDVPGVIPDDLQLIATPWREDARDVWVSGGMTIDQLPTGATVGTGSFRRSILLQQFRRDLKIEAIRGNLDTRLRKLDEGQVDAIVLAAAGLRRLGWSHRITAYFDVDEMIPAVGQGVVAIEARRNRRDLAELFHEIDDPQLGPIVSAERSFLRRIGGDCYTPLGCHAERQGSQMRLVGMLADADGRRVVIERITGGCLDAERLGRELAEQILSQHGLR